ncbi:MAG: DUF4124 domain-containing protein [Bdellovibrionota bacterium]
MMCAAFNRSFTALFFFSLLIGLRPAESQNVYQWTDGEGRVHYTTDPKVAGKGSQTALPPLQRENIDERIKAIKQQTPQNCVSHGGIDCTRGADEDGSVVCLDGYRDAVMRFNFECMEARLHADYLVLSGSESLPHARNLIRKLAGRKPDGLQLTLRNLSNVEAFDIKVSFVFGRRFTVKADGPEKLAPYGSADYILHWDDSQPRTIAEIEQSRYKVDCTNCSAVLGASAALTN